MNIEWLAKAKTRPYLFETNCVVASLATFLLLLVLLAGTVLWTLSDDRLAVPLPFRRRIAANVVAGLLALTMTSCSRVAESPNMMSLIRPDRSDQVFDRAVRTWDTDRNGQVTCQEWQAYADRMFVRFDADRDGHLNGREYDAMSLTDRLFEQVSDGYFDADRDGRVSRAELVQKPNPAFARWDKDRNCVLENAEMPPRQKPRPMKKPGPGGGGKSQGPAI